MGTLEENEEVKPKKKHILAKIFFGLILILLIAAGVFYNKIKTDYELKKIQVSGNEHYTDAEIVAFVTEGKNTDNTLFFIYEYKKNPVENITFIDKFVIEMIDNNTITITVYEKTMAGCVAYMDSYVYFDDEGTVLDISSEHLEDVPCIAGLSFSSIVIGDKLPVEDKDLFQNILTMTQLIEKNQLIIDEIRYNTSGEIFLYKDDIKIELGDGDNLEDKMMNLAAILETVEGRSGTLDMSDYTATTGNAIFKAN